MNTKWILGILAVLIVSSSVVYITFMNDLKIRVDTDKTTFYVKPGSYWLVSGREYNKLFDGSSQMNRDRSSITVDTYINENANTTTIIRNTDYIRGPKIVDTYFFDGMDTNKELFPIEHIIQIFNASGKYYRYEVRDLTYDGKTIKLSPNIDEWSFGKNMKVEWDKPFRWAWIYKSGILKVQYKINSDYEVFHNRLFDPDSFNMLDGESENRTYEYETTVNISTDYSYYTIHDSTGRVINASTTSPTLNYSIDLLRYEIENVTLLTVSHINEINSKDEIYKAELNVSSPDLDNIVITYNSSTQDTTVSSLRTSLAVYLSMHNNCTIDDSIYSRNAGVIGDPTFSDGSCHLDGDDCLSLEDNAEWNNLDNSMSISMWVNMSPQVDTYQMGFDWLGTEGIQLWADRDDTEKPRFRVYDPAEKKLNSTTPADDNQWHMMTGTVNATHIRFYVNSTPIGVVAHDGITVDASTTSYFGCENAGGGATFLTGQIKEVSIFNTTLSHADVIKLYNNSDPLNLSDTSTTINSVSFPGTLNKDGVLFQDEFIYSDTNYTNYNISFESAETKIVYINFSSHGNYSRSGYFNLTIKAFSLDADNVFSISEDMEYLNTSDVTELGTFTNVTNPFHEDNVTESFLDNATSSRWIFDYYSSFQKGCRVADGCAEVYCTGSECMGNTFGLRNDYYYLPNISYFTIQTYASGSNGGELYLELTDLTDSVQLMFADSDYSGGCGASGCYATVRANMTFRKVDENTWNISTTFSSETGGSGNVDVSPSSSGTEFDVSSLDEPYYLRWRLWAAACSYDVGSCSANGEFSRFHIKGIQLNKTNSTFTGLEGSGAATITGNWTSSMINSTASDITRATLSATIFQPASTSITSYISNDDGTTFEETVLGESHLFSSTGNQIRIRFKMSSTDNYTSPIVLDYDVEVVASAITGLSLDVGSDGDYEMTYDYELNSTSTPVYWELNDSSINTYISNNCENDSHCLIPISLITESGGTTELSGVNLTENINPVRLDTSVFQADSITLTSSVSGARLRDFEFDYRGSKNITVEAHDAGRSSFINRTIQVVYSSIDLYFPSNALYWQIFPSSRNQSGIEPYGQNSTHGVWNVNTSREHNIDVYARYNETLDSCVTQMQFRSQNFSTSSLNNLSTLNITNLTTSSQKIIEGINDTAIANIRTYTMINCSQYSGNLIVPYFCFFTICSDCVKTQDWEDYCDIYE